MSNNMQNSQVQAILKDLFIVWSDFESQLMNVPIIKKVYQGHFRLQDYKNILINHRQQVIEGSRWIALASASISNEYLEARSTFLQHANTEHRDYRMLETDYVAVGGKLDKILNAEKNIGTMALNAWMFHQARQKNPFDLIGAMYIIESLGKKIAASFAQKIQATLKLNAAQTRFYSYHAVNDEDHLQQLYDFLDSGILNIENLPQRIVKTAKVTAMLYILQWQQIGNQ